MRNHICMIKTHKNYFRHRKTRCRRQRGETSRTAIKYCYGVHLLARTKQSYLIEGGFSWVLCGEHKKKSKSLAAKMCFALRILSSEMYLPLFLYVTVSPSSCLPAAKGSVCLPVEIICGYLKSVITPCVFLTCDHLAPYEDAVI